MRVPTQSSFVTTVHQDPVSKSLIDGEVCLAMLTSRERHTGDTTALAADLENQDTDGNPVRGDRERWQHDWAVEHEKTA